MLVVDPTCSKMSIGSFKRTIDIWIDNLIPSSEIVEELVYFHLIKIYGTENERQWVQVTTKGLWIWYIKKNGLVEDK
jgi:hypothetical protein